MSDRTTSTGFDGFAGTYESALQQGLSATGESKDYFAVQRVEFLKKQLARLGEKPGKVLDFGCGTGTSVPLLLGLGSEVKVMGVDVSEESLKVAAETHSGNGNIEFRTFRELPAAGEMDLVFCNGVFHHIPVEERGASMKYVFDSLRAGGVFAFWENNPWNPGTRLVMSRIPFDRDAVKISPPTARRLVLAAGFEVISTQFVFFFPRILAWLRWLEPRMAGIPLGGQYMVLCRKPGSMTGSAA